MEHNLIPIIRKKPSTIILHVGTHDVKNLPSRTVLHNLLKLKFLVKDSLPTCKVFVSTPTLRTDHGKAQITVSLFTKHLLQLKIDKINNNNINVRHRGGKGLHFNQIQNFWVKFSEFNWKILKNWKDVQISRITVSLSLNILSDLSLPLQVEEATHLCWFSWEFKREK